MGDAPELLPCPFCGGDAAYGGDGKTWFVNCADCLVSTNILIDAVAPETKEHAAAAWNRRADLAPTDAEVEAAAKAAWDKAEFFNVWDPATRPKPWPPMVEVEADEWREIARAALLAGRKGRE